jgi:hypothetical protein
MAGGALALDHATLPEDGGGHGYLSAVIVSGVAIWSIVDLVRLPSAVREQNRRRATVTAAPFFLREGGGLVLAGRF